MKTLQFKVSVTTPNGDCVGSVYLRASMQDADDVDQLKVKVEEVKELEEDK